MPIKGNHSDSTQKCLQFVVIELSSGMQTETEIGKPFKMVCMLLRDLNIRQYVMESGIVLSALF